jgi:hypothetical protein
MNRSAERNQFISLSEQVAVAKERLEGTLAWSQLVLDRNRKVRRQTGQLRKDCKLAMLQCRATALRTSAERQSRRPPERTVLELAFAIAGSLAALGLVAFVVEPPADTATRQ